MLGCGAARQLFYGHLDKVNFRAEHHGNGTSASNVTSGSWRTPTTTGRSLRNPSYRPEDPSTVRPRVRTEWCAFSGRLEHSTAVNVVPVQPVLPVVGGPHRLGEAQMRPGVHHVFGQCVWQEPGWQHVLRLSRAPWVAPSASRARGISS